MSGDVAENIAEDDDAHARFWGQVEALQKAGPRDVLSPSALALARVEWISELLAGLPRELRGDLLAAALDEHHAGMPSALLGPVVEEARCWAQWSNPLELEAYLLAICDVLRERSLAEVARKRLLLRLWEGLPDDWRRRFVQKVTGR